MANKKTSEELNRDSLFYGDIIRTAVANDNNFQVPAERLLAVDINSSDLLDKISSSTLIPSQWYKAINFIFDSYTTGDLIVQAVSTSSLDLYGFYTDGFTWFKIYLSYNNSGITPIKAVDEYGNLYYDCQEYNYDTDELQNHIIPIYARDGKAKRFKRCEFSLYNEINLTESEQHIIEDCVFISTQIQWDDSLTHILYLYYVKSINSIIQSANGSYSIDASINNVELNSATITFRNNNSTYESAQCSIDYSKINNSTLDIVNAASIIRLNIYGSYSFDGSIPQYVCDGLYQTQVSNWGGDVYGNKENGHSTVFARVAFNASASTQRKGWNATSIFGTGINSPVGVYLIEEHPSATNTTYTFTDILDIESKYHLIIFRPKSSLRNNQYTFSAATARSGISATSKMLMYHGATAKTGQLITPNSYISLRYRTYDNTGLNSYCYHVEPNSPHYD